MNIVTAEDIDTDPAAATRGQRAEYRLAPLEQLLTEGGDARIVIGAGQTVNQYGCRPFPDNGLLAFGSSTASVISEAGFAAAARLHQQLQYALTSGPPAAVHAHEISRMRQELLRLCKLDDMAGLDLIFAASGTDLHLIAGQLAGGRTNPALAVLMEPQETGRGVPAAIAGRHFGARAALGDAVQQGEPLHDANQLETVPVAIRNADGNPRPAAEIDAEVEALVRRTLDAGRPVLLTLIDVSKTGMIAPSPACARALQRMAPGRVEVLVDACQLRLAPATLRAYLDNNFMVALTGSKFLTGPTFSGALLVPATVGQRLRDRALPKALSAYSSAADWPRGWAAADSLAQLPNFGLLLRWEAALQELRAFRALPEAQVAAFLREFASAIEERLNDDPSFEPLPVPPPDRQPLAADSWDGIPTIFPFILYRRSGRRQRRPLERDKTLNVYRLLAEDLSDSGNMPNSGIDHGLARLRCQLGQPVACGERHGIAVSALRVCASARLVVEALTRGNTEAVIRNALAALDKAAQLAAL